MLETILAKPRKELYKRKLMADAQVQEAIKSNNVGNKEIKRYLDDVVGSVNQGQEPKVNRTKRGISYLANGLKIATLLGSLSVPHLISPWLFYGALGVQAIADHKQVEGYLGGGLAGYAKLAVWGAKQIGYAFGHLASDLVPVDALYKILAGVEGAEMGKGMWDRSKENKERSAHKAAAYEQARNALSQQIRAYQAPEPSDRPRRTLRQWVNAQFI